MDGFAFRYLMSLAVHEKLNIQLMDIVIVYLYETLDNDISIKISKRFSMLKACKSNFIEIYSIKLQLSLYKFKQSRH